jgi:nicotinate-nucleotide pyrophosphorylase (carboxylating)
MLPVPDDVGQTVARALAEDVGSGDVTADLVPPGQRALARVLCREEAVICGRPWFDEVFRQLDPGVSVRWLVTEGEEVAPDQWICELEGPARPILTGERTALNFLQTLSGTAGVARRYARALAGTRSRVLDTRKTLPGLRSAQKYAVRCGGCDNHRIGLYDAVLIKENHIQAAGSIATAVGRARSLHPGLKVEVEVEDLAQLREALAAGADVVMLDNFDLPAMREAVAITAGRSRLEVSGNVDLGSLARIAATGVDYISVGALTKHLRAVDLSLRLV